MIGATELIPGADVVLITLDTLRFDVAQAAWQSGETPVLARLLPDTGWEARHAPGNFTFASHQAMFAGFLPTPRQPGRHPRLFALEFPGSETTGSNTCVLHGATIVEGLAMCGYATVCVGGVGFFNKQNPLGNVMPGYFQTSHWSEQLGVTDSRSTEHQVQVALEAIDRTPVGQPLFLFVNVSAIHQPNWFYVPSALQDGAGTDSKVSQRHALRYVDSQLAPLMAGLEKRVAARDSACLLIVCSDHGTAYGEDGYHGHRLAHESVWTVPYLETVLQP